MRLGGMLRAIPQVEATPPLYYVVAWVWARVFGLDEPGIRSLSALAGTATVPVVYLAARELATRRIGLVAAALEYALVQTHAGLQRDDWRGVARLIGPSPDRRTLVADPLPQVYALAWYRPELRLFPDSGAAVVREIDVVGPTRDAPLLRSRLLGSNRVALERRQRYLVAPYRFDRPTRVTDTRLRSVLSRRRGRAVGDGARTAGGLRC
jgi:Dolichyl-phosphate-mannose-protein mannosyltransferase